MKVLVFGDSYMPEAVFRGGLAALEGEHEVTYLELEEDRAFEPQSASERGLREYLGAPAQLIEQLGDHEVLVFHGAPVTAAVLDAGRSLRLLCCARGGPVNVDLEAAAERGIPVVRTPGKNAEAVADLTLAFLVMLARGLPTAQRFLAEGGTLGESAFEGKQFFGHDLGGHTLGLLGYGNVGKRVAARARAFGMELIAHDPYAEGMEADGVEEVTLGELLGGSHFLSLHARETAETERLMDAAAFARMRTGSYLVNTARPSLIDEAALAAALGDGQLAGAALDVVEDGAPFAGLDSVILTPHVGGATEETLARGASMLRTEIERLARGEAPLNQVGTAAGPAQ